MHVIEVIPCTSSPCQHDGECQDTAHGFKCKCLANYQGEVCSGRYYTISVNKCNFQGNANAPIHLYFKTLFLNNSGIRDDMNMKIIGK